MLSLSQFSLGTRKKYFRYFPGLTEAADCIQNAKLETSTPNNASLLPFSATFAKHGFLLHYLQHSIFFLFTLPISNCDITKSVKMI